MCSAPPPGLTENRSCSRCPLTGRRRVIASAACWEEPFAELWTTPSFHHSFSFTRAEETCPVRPPSTVSGSKAPEAGRPACIVEDGGGAMATASATADEIKESILDTIGETPLVRLSRLDAEVRPRIVAKLEVFNPGGSIKDRIALGLIAAAERDGRLRPGGTIIESTSGNTGTGLALVALLKGARVLAVMPEKMSKEKIDLLRVYGALVDVAPTEVPPDSPESYYRVADRLTEEIPGAFQPNQYFNQANPEAHYRTTGPEIWRQTEGRLTHFVTGVGTGGTITGAGRYLKERNEDIEVIGADPEGSIYSGGEVKPYLVEGVGEDFWPESFDPSVGDRYVTVSDRDSFLATRRLAETEGILAGGSSGMAVHAALEVARGIDDPGAMVLVILPDGGRSYLSKVYNDAWL